MITRRGVGFALVAVAAFFLASSTRVGWLHLADAVLWGILLIGFVTPWVSLRGVRAGRTISRPTGAMMVTEGGRVNIEIAVHNPSRWPVFLLSASHSSTLEGDPDLVHRFFLFRAASQRATVLARNVKCDRRGWQVLGPLQIESTAPFGMFRRRKIVEPPTGMLVHPLWLPMSRVGLLDAGRGDADGRASSRTGDEVAGARRYVVGDARRDIHWRNSARAGRLLIKERSAQDINTVILAIDTSWTAGTGTETTLDYAARIAASVSRVIIANGGSVCLAAAGMIGPPVSDWTDFMRALALLSPRPSGPLGNLLSTQQPGSRILAVIGNHDAVSVAALSALARRGVTVGAVVLEGFERGDGAAVHFSALRYAGAAAVPCRLGDLEGAIESIERGVAGGATPVAA